MAASRLFVCTESGASRGLGEDIPGPARLKLCPSSLQAELSQARPEADDEALAKAFETAFAATPAWFIKHGSLIRLGTKVCILHERGITFEKKNEFRVDETTSYRKRGAHYMPSHHFFSAAGN